MYKLQCGKIKLAISENLPLFVAPCNKFTGFADPSLQNPFNYVLALFMQAIHPGYTHSQTDGNSRFGLFISDRISDWCRHRQNGSSIER
jgi:hypothetical protein